MLVSEHALVYNGARLNDKGERIDIEILEASHFMGDSIIERV